jgi:type IV secretory pathway VirB10-like protein
MTRTLLAIATVFIGSATLLSSTANACISCNYVPEVIKAGEKQAYVKHAPRQQAHIALAVRKPVRVKQQVAANAPVVKKAAPKAELQDVKPAESTAEAAPAATTATAAEPVQVAEAGTAVAASTSATCMKFFPTIGKTLEVPCQ